MLVALVAGAVALSALTVLSAPAASASASPTAPTAQTAPTARTAQTAPTARAAQTPAVCPAAVALVNGGFEANSFSGVLIVDQSQVPGWSTTASDGAIELWASDAGVPPGSGNNFAELNANQVSTLYQDLATVPGELLRWQLQHRGREGTDVMAVDLGPPSGPLVQQGGPIADDPTAWGTYSGLYVVPAGQTTTRFAFVSVSSVGGDSLGNFLDSISLGTAACVIASKSVANITHPGLSPVVGDTLEYTVTARNDGGVPASTVVVTDTVPVGTTYVAGSMTDANGAVTDAAGDDTGENAAGTLQWRIGDGADASTGGSIPAGESRAVTFRVTVDSGTVGANLQNAAQVSYVETLSTDAAVATSNTTATTVSSPAAATLSATGSSPVGGLAIATLFLLAGTATLLVRRRARAAR
ncbi:MAG: hypothetical protein ABIO06_01545 [Pseudolysinimonas sp.]